jgi:AsmA protein
MRWIIRFGVGLAVLVLLGLGLLAMVPAERVAAAVSAEFESMTGRKLTLTGDVTPRLWPSLGVTTGPVSIANADWAETEAPLFQAEGLVIDINYGALLGGSVQIEGLSADRPQIVLERDPDGRESWDFGAASGAVSGAEGAGDAARVPEAATPVTLDSATITGGSIRLIDRQADRVIALDAVDATLAIPDLAGPFTLSLTGLATGKPVAMDVTGGVFSAFAAGRVVPLTASLTAGGSSLSFDGRAGMAPLVAEGTLVADLSDLPALGALIGSTLAAPGPGLGKDRLSATGDLTLDGTGAVFLRGATIVADGNQVTGDLDLRPGEARPKLVGQLTAGPLIIGSGPAEGGGERSGDAAPAGWSEDDIDVSALGALDAEVVLVAPSVSVGGLTLGETRVLVTLDRSRAVTEIRQMAAYGGQITGEFVVNGRGGLSVGGKLAFAGLDLQALSRDVAGYDRLVASGDLDLRFLGVGNSVAAIMQSLEGEGALELGRGEVRGLDIAAMLQTLDPAYIGDEQKTAFDGLAGTFTIADGVLSNSDLKLVAPQLTAAGAGEVDLGARTLNYRLRPTALAAADGSGGVMVPLLITGPWAEPRFRLDLESIAREKMEAEARAAAAEAEARAKAELERRLEEELGIEVAPDESLGDAALRGAEEALEDETRKLLEDILGND